MKLPEPLCRLERLNILSENDSDDRRNLYAYALDNLEISDCDYLTIKDLMDIAGIQDDIDLEMILIALFCALEEGSICMSLSEDRMKKLLPGLKSIDLSLSKFTSALQDGKYDTLFCCAKDTSETDFKPLIILENSQPKRLYFQKYYEAEKKVRAIIARRIQQQSNITSTENPVNINFSNDPPLDNDQKSALEKALTATFMVITGGPGTGKTSILKELLQNIQIPPAKIALAAPTGRAARRMTESISKKGSSTESIEGKTIHRLLGYHPDRGVFHYHYGNPLPVDLLIVDEVSMIDVCLMASLLEAVPEGARIIFLGDPHQLPSVGAGAVLTDILPSEDSTIPDMPVLARLHQSHRSNDTILQLARAINHYSEKDGINPLEGLEKLSAAQFRTINNFDDLSSSVWMDAIAEQKEEWESIIIAWSKHFYANTKYRQLISAAASGGDENQLALIKHVQQAQILTPVREGPYGSVTINSIIRDRLRGGSQRGKTNIFSGLPIIIKQNSNALRLNNGDIGVLLQTSTGMQALFPRGEGVQMYPFSFLPPFELAFSITIHKSQGSEYENVLVVIPPEMSSRARRLLTREILYTAITRAKERVLIYSSESDFLFSCMQQIIRETGGAIWKA
jgi:exodeoxyribonuclease V alpha subunit